MEIKKLTAQVYESSSFTKILGEVLHPGGSELTARMAEIAEITKASLVLDLACGKGATVHFLWQQYLCRVIGIELSSSLISLARNKVERLSSTTGFVQGDVESLPFNESVFDVVLSECSFSLLPNKQAGAQEIKRVLKPGGKLVIADVILRNNLPEEVKSQAAFVFPCLAGAKSVKGYLELLEKEGFENPYVEDHSEEMKKVGYRIFASYGSFEGFIKNLSQNSTSLKEPNTTANRGDWLKLLKQGKPGYALIAVTKP